MRLLFIASDRMEFSGILARASERRSLRFGADWACAARLGRHDAVLAANGVGAERAAAAVDAALDGFQADAIVSTGFCGALAPELEASAVVVATCVIGPGGSYSALPVASAARFLAGPICSISYVCRTAAEKRELRAGGAIAVEMEASGIANRAQKRRLPFYCVRAITDRADESLSNDFNAVLRPDGHFATMLLLGNALRHPSVRLPELIRLRKRCIRASHALGDFFADCRF